MPVPPLEEQRHIVERLNKLHRLVAEAEQLQSDSAAALSALLPSILDRAFKGEL
jgi:type I restriction enzyme S subunit